ncbi:MAG: HAMP domain-containing sensor histidine kinase, partial [Elusimicrobiota bacterium]|nr:HAMP domain-containing sensor histidine kinase [Elusimicrobiota bacterium]
SDLTDIAMIEGGKFKVEKTSFNFSEIFKDFMPAIEITAGQKNVVLDYANIDADVEVLGDKFRLSQVLQNLLTNAIKFTSAKGAVKLNTRIAGKWLYVYIKDSGIGIHPTELKKVFERSYQAKHQKDKKLTKMGWGFGLSIAQEIILQHNGEIAVDSRGLGHGSTFWFKIPI